jgi:hypothetical protein
MNKIPTKGENDGQSFQLSSPVLSTIRPIRNPDSKTNSRTAAQFIAVEIDCSGIGRSWYLLPMEDSRG